MDEGTLVFVYGTARKGLWNHRYVSGGKFLGTYRTKEEYCLRYDGLPFLIKTPSLHHVTGEVYELNDEQLENLDALEGHPNWYRREKITVKGTSQELTAYAYFFPQERGKVVSSGEIKDVIS